MELKKEYAVVRKGTSVAIAMKPAGKKWSIVGSNKFHDVESAKAWQKKMLDKLIKAHPNNKVRTSVGGARL